MWPWNWASLKNTDSWLAPLQGHRFQLEHLRHPFPQSHASPSHGVLFLSFHRLLLGTVVRKLSLGDVHSLANFSMDLYDPPPHLLSPEPVRGGRRGWGHGWVTRQRGATWSHLGNKGNGHGLTPESATSLLCNFGRVWSVVWASVFFYWRQGQTLGSPLTVHKGITGGKLAGATPQSAASGGPAWTQQRLTHPGPADCRQAELTGSQLWRVLRHEGRGFGLAESSCWRLSEGKHPVLTAEMKWCSHLLRVGTSWLRWG